MYKSVFSALCALGMTFSVAQAEDRTFDADISYDGVLLSSASGMKKVRKSIKHQARIICTNAPKQPAGWRTNTVDWDCVDYVVKEATKAIETKEGVDFASLSPASAQPIVISEFNE